MNKTVGSKMKLCGTCMHWCGKQDPNPSRTFISFDDHEKGKCSAVFGKIMPGNMAACNKWEQRFR